MAVIRQYVSNAPPLRASNMGVQAEQEMGYHSEREAQTIPRDISRGVRGLQQGIGQVEHVVASNEVSGVYQQLASLTVKAHENLSQTLNSADPKNGDPTQGWNESFLQPALDKIGSDLSTPEAQHEFQRASAGLEESLFNRANGEWDAKLKQHTATNVTQMGIDFGNAAAVDPASLNSILKMSDAGVQSSIAATGGRVSKEDGDALALRNRNQITDTAATALVSKGISNPNFNPQMAATLADELNSPMFMKNMSPRTHQHLLGVLEKAHDTQLVAQSSIFQSRAPAMLDQIKMTGDPSQFDAGIQSFVGKSPETTAVDRQKLMDDRNSALAYYTVSQHAGMVSQANEGAYLTARSDDLAGAQPGMVKAADAAHKAAVQFFADRDKAFASGTQADFLIQHNDTLKSYYQDWTQNPTAQNYEKYAVYSEAVQHHLYPNAPTHLLTPQITAEVSSTMHNLTQAGAPEVENAVQGLSQKYGAYWPQIATEAMEKGAMSPTQYVGAQLYSSPQNYGLAAQAFRASTMSQKDLAAAADAAAGGTGIISLSSARAAAATAFQGFAKTLGTTANGGQIISAYTDALSKVMMLNGSTSNAQSLAKQMLTGQYTVANTVRIPNWKGVNTSAVTWALSDTDHLVPWDNLAVPKSFSGLGPADQHTNYISQLQNTSQWHTNQDESGVTLYDENGYNVLTKQGKPVTLTWQQLEEDAGKHEGTLSKIWSAL